MRPMHLFFPLIATICTSAAFAASPVAYVYVPTPTGIYGYAASTGGELTEIKGSPFSQTSGLMVGSNKSYFITVDSDYVHSYKVASDGAIGAQVSEINTQLYSGSECGTANGAVLDHTGQDVYVLLNVGLNATPCAVFQTFEIGKSGTLTFKGATGDVSHGLVADTLPTITGNSKYAFNAPEFAQNWTSPGAGCNPYMNGFSRESSGALDYIAAIADVTGPTPEPGGADLLPVPWLITDDPTDHLAIAVFNTDGPACGNGGPVQLASYTVDSHGDLTSTNTWGNMPTVPGGVSSMVLNKTGAVLAVATGPGVEFFHFNGAKPITEFTGILGNTGYVNHMGWDTSNHLYAVNGSSGRLHVYDVTTTAAKEASGSPYMPPGGASNVLVVSK